MEGLGSISREMLASGLGCAFSNGALNSLETTKVKLQLLNAAKPAYACPTMAGVMTQVAREDGIVRGLMTPGLTASLVRSMTYGAYRAGLYTSVRDAVTSARSSARSDEVRGPSLVDRMAAGMFTGALGSAISCPLDVVRTRMQAESGSVGRDGKYTTGLRRGEDVRYRTFFSTLSKVTAEEGVRAGLYRGATVTITRAALLNGSQLASYDTMKRNMADTLGWDEGPALHVVCSVASGVIAQTVVMPIDTVKSHMMLGHGWKDMMAVMRRNAAHGGFRWFFRGYIPACAGQGSIMVLQMPLIEEMRRLLGVEAI